MTMVCNQLGQMEKICQREKEGEEDTIADRN